MPQQKKQRASRNRTITLSSDEQIKYNEKLIQLDSQAQLDDITNKTINQDLFEAIPYLPDGVVDLLFIDPPYNLNKDFNGKKFSKMTDDEYEEWVDSWIAPLVPKLKENASVYVCGDWKSSSALYRVLNRHFIVRNRITWEREKGRGSKSNWKNCSEDIWFATYSKDYYFNVEAVKQKKKVIAPYKQNGKPKDWKEEEQGNFRLTHPSNLWTDITIPFWSMPENTDHPTQKPEKLIAKIILASSQEGDIILDPFLGVGTTSVVAKKLNRKYCGIETDNEYACITEKRLEIAEDDEGIQGYADGVFWERNSLNNQKMDKTKEQNNKQTFL